MPRGRIKGRVYPDMLYRGACNMLTRMKKLRTSTVHFNACARKYSHAPLNKKLQARIERLETDLSALVEDLAFF